uniref:Reverse transcriptase domain-containing protein n=1 Tax=Tanacetum cinerariifolium TaxID=118510 RepID=A0A6L2NNT3_TANCI|nr:reverse transcriptase domain-containing protein [Tanacetum cinerariifolium]
MLVFCFLNLDFRCPPPLSSLLESGFVFWTESSGDSDLSRLSPEKILVRLGFRTCYGSGRTVVPFGAPLLHLVSWTRSVATPLEFSRAALDTGLSEFFEVCSFPFPIVFRTMDVGGVRLSSACSLMRTPFIGDSSTRVSYYFAYNCSGRSGTLAGKGSAVIVTADAGFPSVDWRFFYKERVYIRGEVVASNQEWKKSLLTWKQHEARHKQNFKKGCFKNQQRSERRQDRFTLLSKSPKEVMAVEKGKFKAPPPMTTPTEKRNGNKFCEFHEEVGHNTDECMHLKRQIEELLKNRKLSLLIKDLKQYSGKDQPKANKKGETSSKDKALAILMKKCIKDPVKIHHIKQREGESTKDFMCRFKIESRDVKGAPEVMRISGFMYGITNPELIKCLHDKISKSVDEMMKITTSFLRGELAAGNQERKKSLSP